ncbi:hypothetical protein OEZ86_014372 [Tetradesmus obliquus]|nr:hypothetical protein OEZ86_014372 [Tetradesmus obliquus]
MTAILLEAAAPATVRASTHLEVTQQAASAAAAPVGPATQQQQESASGASGQLTAGPHLRQQLRQSSLHRATGAAGRFLKLAGGVICVEGMAVKIKEPTRNKPSCRLHVSPAFLAKCFPDLQQQHGQRQQVQLRFSVDGADSTPADGIEAHAGIGGYHCCRSSGSGALRFIMSAAEPVLQRYAGHTVTGMSGVRGSTQLTLHLQSPAAAAAAQQAAEAAAAAAEAVTTCWQDHEAPGGSTSHERDVRGSR